MQPSVQKHLIYLVSLLNLLLLWGSPAEWGNAARSNKRCCPRSVLNCAVGKQGVSRRTLTSSVTDSASLTLRVLLCAHHQVWPSGNTSCTHSWAQKLLILVWMTLDFLANVSSQYSLWSSRPAYWSLSSFHAGLAPLFPLCFMGKSQAHAQWEFNS